MKKGFTLVELLVTIGVLVLILLIVTPSLVGVINDSREKSFEETKRNIKGAANNYMIENSGNFPENVGESHTIEIETLQDEGYLKRNIINPKNGEIIENAYIVVTKITEDEFEYVLEYDY